jgi:CRISPR-associated endonuclease Csn1
MEMETVHSELPRYVLGLDLGSASVGWAMIQLNEADEPIAVLRAGVRIFDSAVEGNIEKGQDVSNAVARRTARLMRRQLRRRAGRQKQLFKLLQKSGLLPAYESSAEDAAIQRHEILNLLDRELASKWLIAVGNRGMNFTELPLYVLRKAALDSQLEVFELGRVLYHFSQRRGYQSNRRASNKDKVKDEEQGKVLSGISQLETEMKASGARTLGEYFAGLDPHTQKVRRRWTHRRMFEDEFGRIWEAQRVFYPALLTEDVRREICEMLFFQRPIREQTNLIGKCDLEPDQRRAHWATLEAQRFRLLQKVNDLEIILPGQILGIPLTDAQRLSVYEFLDEEGDQKFDAIRKHLGIEKNIGFNLQRGGETKLRGNLINKIMRKAFGNRWEEMDEEQKRLAVDEWRTIQNEDGLCRRFMQHWGLNDLAASTLAAQAPPSGYCQLSRKAIRRLFPLMLLGKRFMAARQEVPEYRPQLQEPMDRIPPVRETLKNLRNPAIERSLTELRKVINAMVGEYGKPTEIRIELARDLKKSRSERAKGIDTSRKRERERAAVKEKLLRELGLGFTHPSRADIEKALLWEECGGICPYTGRSIEFASLFGQAPQFDVEHILPLSRIPDDSFGNKTLCYHEENRHCKGNKTPFEAYGSDPEVYDQIIIRIKAWKSPNSGKLRRFEMRTLQEMEGFSTRQLNDTRYSSRLAMQLVAALYGGDKIPQEDGSNRQVVFASSGMVTATLRKTWGMEEILREAAPSANGQTKGKPRTDHRHHAIDAIAIALTRQATIQTMSRTAALAPSWMRSGRAFRGLQQPWKNFIPSIRPAIDSLLISHRPEHRLTGALHDETNYGKPRKVNGKQVVHVRKPVSGLSVKEIESIVDPAIRDAVRAKAQELGDDLKKCNPKEGVEDWPLLVTKSGKFVPIKRVRIQKTLEVESIAGGTVKERYVALSSNHHVAIFAELDEHGKERRWEPIIVSLYEAMNRKRSGLPVVQRACAGTENYTFKFSLMGGDTVRLHKECDHSAGICKPSFWRLRTIASNGQMSLVRIQDARLKTEIQSSKQWWSPVADSLRKQDCEKITIDTLGNPHTSSD